MSENTTQKPVAPHELADEITKEATPIFDALMRYKHIIAGAAAVVIAVAAIYAGVTLWNAHTHSSAKEKLGNILLTTSAQERIDTLKAFAADAPDSVRNGALFELAGSQMQMGQFDDAAQTWDQLIARLETPELLALAKLGKARSLLLGGKAEEALTVARELRAAAPESFATPANRIIAAAAEQSGDTQTALEAYQALLSGGQAADAEFLNYKIGRLQAAQ
ncbi:MAG: tetratricopeptide repeat protein [Desulfovibrio sp.]